MALNDLINLQVINAVENAEYDAELPHRRFHVRDDPFLLSDVQFVKLFRLTKDLVNNLIDSLEPYMTPQSRTSALDVSTKILIALRFFASGSYQMDIGRNVNFAVSQSSISRCIHEVVNAVTRPEIINHWVQFPNTLQQFRALRQEFHARYHFPGVIGCIDCTHVAIVPPKVNDPLYPEHLYLNRKGYHSINVQLVCDWRLKILNVNARFPGSTHDVYIWNNCNVLPAMEHLHRVLREPNFFLLGDSGYPLRPWLLTPIANPLPDTPEERYNERQMSCRSIIERCNGVLKMRFRCLLKHRTLHYDPETASRIINTCVVLHNMCITHNVPDPDPQEGDENLDLELVRNGHLAGNQNEANARRINPDLAAGRLVQRRLITNYFTRV